MNEKIGIYNRRHKLFLHEEILDQINSKQLNIQQTI